MGGNGNDMEALSPRDANAQRSKPQELKKAVANLKATRAKGEKEAHPPPPPSYVTEPPCRDRREGAVYEIRNCLGKGGFAICYEGKLNGTSKRYALKIVKSSMPIKMEQKFQTELQIHSKMRQQNIVQFHRAFTFENSTYLVLELCPNGSLMDMVKRRKGLTEPEVRFYSVQITGAIKYMHSKGIIHRDLKMGNIFLDRYMNAKVGDFGLAALLVTGKDMHTIRRTTLCGTPNYIAPEILEKGRKGHDHMVDIWSLGIIMFAMLTTKPPFQASTTDEIYRRARERDYDWPEAPNKYISREAKELVASMLQDADMRPEPDQIVQDNFFLCGYMPVQSDITIKLRECPPDNPAFYERNTSAQVESNRRTLHEMCRECGVGPWNQVQLVTRQIWRECAEEEQHGLTPVIPLAKGIVYRPLEEVKGELKLQQELKLQSQLSLRPKQSSQSAGKTVDRAEDQEDELIDLNEAVYRPKATTAPTAPTGLLRAPPQSFAAQQRMQNKPATGTFRSQPPAEPAPTPTESLRTRPRRVLPAASASKAEEVLPAASQSRTRSVRAKMPATVETREPPPQRVEPEKSAKQIRMEVERPDDQRTIFSPSEYQEQVKGTKPDEVLGRLKKFEKELERALNARSMAIVSPKDQAPPPPRIVVKWVDYTNKFGLGYILDDGSVGCILKAIPFQEGDSPERLYLPPACMLVHGAERHALRRNDMSYPDRHQVVPMNQSIYFYENNGEAGITRVRVSPKAFHIPTNSDGTAGKLAQGKDIYDHRKRERIVLWKKFANYMIAFGREMDMRQEVDIQTPTPTADPTTAPNDIVIFYQRFGDVGFWLFCDGHMQFNFPDHTKIVLDSTGTWCHFWHLTQSAALALAQTGTLPESALDERTVLTYPLQTLLNFTVPARQPMVSSRRRPEIAPEMREIPSANQFRKKIEFIRDMVREWTSNGGIGNTDLSREKRLRWMGARELAPGGQKGPQKMVWVSVGARWGDHRVTCLVDPRKPGVLGEDFDEERKREERKREERRERK